MQVNMGTVVEMLLDRCSLNAESALQGLAVLAALGGEAAGSPLPASALAAVPPERLAALLAAHVAPFTRASLDCAPSSAAEITAVVANAVRAGVALAQRLPPLDGGAEAAAVDGHAAPVQLAKALVVVVRDLIPADASAAPQLLGLLAATYPRPFLGAPRCPNLFVVDLCVCANSALVQRHAFFAIAAAGRGLRRRARRSRARSGCGASQRQWRT